MEISAAIGLNQFKRINKKPENSNFKPVKLHALNKDVDLYNSEQLRLLPSKSVFFYAKDTGSPHHIEALNKYCPAAKILELKVICLIVDTFVFV